MAERSRDWIWGAVGLALLTVLVILLAPPGAPLSTDRRLTSLRATPDGARALYQTLEELGVTVDRRMTPLAGMDPVRGPLVMLEPVEAVTPAELDSLFAWVERGGRLILAPPLDDAFEERLGLTLRWVDADTLEAGFAVRPHRWTRELGELRGDSYWAFDPDTLQGPALEPLVVDRATGEPVVGLLPRGRGRILAIADGSMLSNGTIRDFGLAPLVALAAAEWAGPADTLWFDEYHHGHRGGSAYRALGSFLLSEAAGRATVQLALVALLALLPAAIRFGAPRPDRPASRRSRLEHVAALGEAYRQGRAEDVARRRLLAGFARHIGRERPPPGGEDAFLDRLERHVATGADAVTAVARAWKAGAPAAELAVAIDHAVHELNRHR